MNRMINRMKNVATREEGATMVEYGLMVALIAVVCLIAVGALGTSVSDIFDNVASEVATPST